MNLGEYREQVGRVPYGKRLPTTLYVQRKGLVGGLGVQVHAVEVVLQDLPVEIEEGALAAECLQPGVGEVIDGVKLVEGFDENCAAAAGRVEDAEALEFLLPGFPEAD